MLASRGAAKIGPESTGKEATVSREVCALIPTAPAVLAPMASPLIVTENTEGAIVVPDVLITIEVAVVALQVMDTPTALLALNGTVGIIEGAKKPEG